MRIVFLGAGAFGIPTLDALARGHDLRAIVTQPDKPAGRSRALTPTPIGVWRDEHAQGTPIFKPRDINDPDAPDALHAVRAIGADAWVIIAYGQKLGEPLLEDRFAINLHASLLPRWRGAAPINHAILAGDTQTGNSVITIAQRMDAGLVLGQSRRPIEPTRTAGELHDDLASDGPALVLRVLDEFAHDTLKPVEQDEALVTRATKLGRADGWVDFHRPARECRCRVHALTPWPGVDVRCGAEPLRLLRVQDLEPDAQQLTVAPPGQLLDAAEGVIACAGGTALRLLEVQPPGKNPMAWREYQRGRADRVVRGVRFEGGPPPC